LVLPPSLKPKPAPQTPSWDSLGVDKDQCSKALTALLAHVEKLQQKREKEDLLGEQEEKLFLVVGLKRQAKREVHMPIRLPLPHPLINPRVSPVSLFVKDPQRQYKDLLESSKITFVNRVIGLEKLRTKHKTFEAKRLLLKEADLFLVDDRVVVEVGKSLGKMWRENKKQPVPITLSRKDLKAELERAISSTYLQINTGTSLSIKFGSTSLHTPTELLSNLISLIPTLAPRLPSGGWSNVQSLHIKSSTSTSLPIFNTSLDDE
ncbi:ribosomal protein L1, partial [Meredithblackwellia eburnea MCA 4105]